VAVTISYSIPVEAFMGGLAVGLAVVFITLLCTIGAATIRRFVDA
jgi:hypothetical protein